MLVCFPFLIVTQFSANFLFVFHERVCKSRYEKSRAYQVGHCFWFACVHVLFLKLEAWCIMMLYLISSIFGTVPIRTNLTEAARLLFICFRCVIGIGCSGCLFG